MKLNSFFNILLTTAIFSAGCATAPKTQKSTTKPPSVMPPGGITTAASLPGSTPGLPPGTVPGMLTGAASGAFPGSSSFSPPRVSPKSFKSFFDSSKTRTQKGLITVYWLNDRYYFEISKALLGKDMLAVTRFARTAAGGSKYGGERANNTTIVLRFEKATDNKLFLRTTLNIISSPDSAKPIFQAVKNSNVDPIAAAFDIYAFNRDTTGYIIDITDYFKGDNQIVSLDPQTKRNFNLSNIALDRSYIETINSMQANTEIRSVKTFNSTPSPFTFIASPSPFPQGQTLPGANTAGAVTIEVNTSIIKLPDVPMKRRFFDPRVGFFTEQITEYLDTVQRANQESFIVRWRLEPKTEDIEKYKRGELVEPKKQIIYYIDPATPAKWKPYLIQGINDWQVAFEQAGFKNAIIGKEWPADSSMSLEAANYSAIRYLASEISNAYGPNVHDPRSGEIFESHIGWYHNIMKLLQNWYLIQAAAIDPGARKMKFDDALMGDLVRFVASHEVGHTLGLRHNMGSSSTTPVEKLRDKAWVEAHGHTASIMDYARFNYVAQPEDHISRKGIYPRIGEYDKWAIKWGYRWTDKSEEQDRKDGNAMIVDSLSKNPRLWFGGEGFGNNDPRSQTEDLGDDAMKASEYGIKNLKFIVKNLPEWTKESGDKYQNLEEIYSELVIQFNRYTNHVSRNIGGVYETFKSVEEKGNVYEPVLKAKQKQAVQWLNQQLFKTPDWILDKNILNKISDPVTNNLSTVQNNVLSSVFSASRLARMLEAENRFGNNTYSVLELLNDLKKGIWIELKNGSNITMNRRNLQKTYVDRMIALLPTTTAAPASTISFFSFAPNTKNSDIPSIARGHLADLLNDIKAAIPRTKDQMSRYHLQDEVQRINLALNPKV